MHKMMTVQTKYAMLNFVLLVCNMVVYLFSLCSGLGAFLAETPPALKRRYSAAVMDSTLPFLLKAMFMRFPIASPLGSETFSRRKYLSHNLPSRDESAASSNAQNICVPLIWSPSFVWKSRSFLPSKIAIMFNTPIIIKMVLRSRVARSLPLWYFYI